MVQLKVFPPIGIARIGDSADEWFIGPEVPGLHARPPGGYKSADCRIKRQGARFRIFAFGDDGEPILEGGHPKEITSAQGEITWTVQLANTKAAAKRFHPIDGDKDRNDSIEGAERETLRIVTEILSISGADQKKAFAKGAFRGLPVPLGELRTDEDGRLIVLGGTGLTRAVHPDGTPWPDKAAPVSADNYDADDWHDDVSDGPVRASVVIDGQTHQAAAARVVVAPPAYAPAIVPAVSLYDRLRQLMVDNKLLDAPSGLPSFVRDIRPILMRARDITRVFAMPGHHWAVTGAASQPAAPSAGVILSNLIAPGDAPTEAAHMPKLLDDDKTKGFALTPIQYAAIKAWAEGQAGADWIDDWPGGEPAPDLSITPAGLIEAALEACIGRGLRPGIEAGRFLTKPENYSDEAFRLKDSIPAGEVTSQMAVPWQFDFVICSKEAPFGWWPTHRPDEVFPEAGGGQTGWFTPELSPPEFSGGKWLMGNWSRLGFVVAKDGALVETERAIACRDISVIVAREVVSEAQAAAAIAGPEAGRIPAAFVVRVGGSKPSELGIESLPVGKDQLSALAPQISLFKDAGSGFSGFGHEPVSVELQSDNLGQTQIVAFTYDITFADTAAFFSNGQPIEAQDITIAAAKPWSDGEKSGVATGEGRITLTNIAAPWIEDGPVLWLSKDLRVFRVVEEGEPIEGVGKMGATAAEAREWIGKVVDRFNQLPQDDHPFDKLLTDQQDSALQLFSATEGGKPVYNFAVARVSYAGKTQPAEEVRVFFRLFTTAATGFEYDPAHAYRRSADIDAPSPLLGLDGAGHVISIPCFARKRVDSAAVGLGEQQDDLNVRTLFPPLKDQAASHGYFGCWLDINQLDPQFPEQPVPPDGAWKGPERQSIQTLINGEHHCLVAEVDFLDRPIPLGATPSDGRIAQRNLAWAEADNPGGPESRTVQHSFMVKAPPRTAVAPLRADELVIHWGGLAPGCRMQVYMPDVEAGEVLSLAAQTMDYTGLRRLDGHTLECLAGDVTYIPIPSGRTRDAPALLSIELPEGVRKGQTFRCVVEQVSGARRVLGAFQLSIPISTARALLGRERRRLSLLRWIAQAKAPDDPWRAVLLRYVDQVAARVKGFGGDPDAVTASPDGNGVAAGPGAKGLACRLLGGLFALACAATVVLGGLDPPPPPPFAFAFAGLAAIAFALLWFWVCKPGLRRVLLMFGAGVAAGAGLLGLLALLGLGGAQVVTWLAASAALGVFALLAALAWPQPSG